MIEERYLDQAIAENRAERNPDAWTIMRLAADLYVKERLFGGEATPPKRSLPAYSMAGAPQAAARQTVEFDGKSEFARAIDGKAAEDIWPIMDDVMSVMATLHPEIYQRAMQMIRAK